MAHQVRVPNGALAPHRDPLDGTVELLPELAYLRCLLANVVFIGPPDAGDRGWVLVDAGVMGSKAFIERAAAQRFGNDAPPACILLTHGHFDHVGVLESLAAEWDTPIYAHVLEHPYLDGSTSYPDPDPSVGGGLMSRLSRFYPTKPVDVSGCLMPLPANGEVPDLPGWRWLHTPGHSPGHVSFWRETDRTLIVGDAFVTTHAESAYATATQEPEVHGPPAYFTVNWEEARQSVRDLAALEPALVVSGHGRAMGGPLMQAALHDLARDFDTIARPPHGRYVEHPMHRPRMGS